MSAGPGPGHRPSASAFDRWFEAHRERFPLPIGTKLSKKCADLAPRLQRLMRRAVEVGPTDPKKAFPMFETIFENLQPDTSVDTVFNVMILVATSKYSAREFADAIPYYDRALEIIVESEILTARAQANAMKGGRGIRAIVKADMDLADEVRLQEGGPQDPDQIAQFAARRSRTLDNLCSTCGTLSPSANRHFSKCGGCFEERYCTETCHAEHWTSGHKDRCAWIRPKESRRAMAARRRSTCACCNKVDEALRPYGKCSLCETVRYCSVDCQRNHWNATHRLTCPRQPDVTRSF